MTVDYPNVYAFIAEGWFLGYVFAFAWHYIWRVWLPENWLSFLGGSGR